MELLRTHGEFASRPESADLLPEEIEIQPPEIAPAVLTAFAAVSGGLDDARDWPELRDAARHGVSLVSAGVVDSAEVERQTCRVVESVVRWGDRLYGLLRTDPTRQPVGVN